MLIEIEKPLAERAAAGDSAALATLLQHYSQDLQYYIGRRLPLKVRHLTSIDDIQQETCFEACRTIAGFKPLGDCAFLRWLMRIANLRIMETIGRYRRRRTHPTSATVGEDVSLIEALEQLRIYRRTPSQSAAAHELVTTVERCICQLVPSQRDVIVCRYLEGLTVEETAKRLNRQTNQVYVLTSRALDVLRDKLLSASRHI